MNITYTDTISAEDCNKLRKSAGWSQMHLDQITTGLKNSAFIVVAKDGETTVGMARVISDGGYIVLVVEVLVLPEYQRKGIGKTMMEKIMEFLRNKLKDGYCIQVDVMAAKGKEDFYEKFGFVKRPNDSFGFGMTQWLKKEDSQ